MTIAQIPITHSGSPSTSVTTILNASGNWANVGLMLCNTSLSSSCTINLYVMNGTPDAVDSHCILRNLVIDPTDTFVFNLEKLLLTSGDRLYATASVSGIVTATASYITI